MSTRPSKLNAEAALVALADAADPDADTEALAELAAEDCTIALVTILVMELVGVMETTGAEVDVVVELALVAPRTGAAMAFEGSARAPRPQGMGLLEPGCVALGGGVVAPESEAIVKRVVHATDVAESADVNW